MRAKSTEPSVTLLMHGLGALARRDRTSSQRRLRAARRVGSAAEIATQIKTSTPQFFGTQSISRSSQYPALNESPELWSRCHTKGGTACATPSSNRPVKRGGLDVEDGARPSEVGTDTNPPIRAKQMTEPPQINSRVVAAHREPHRRASAGRKVPTPKPQRCSVKVVAQTECQNQPRLTTSSAQRESPEL